LLELGQIIGLNLELNEMLVQIARKACEVMGADRSSLFLYDEATDELWSTVALGMEEQVIRIPSGAGIAGHCFKAGETVNIKNAYEDPRFNKEVDAHSGYHTRSLLCTPIHNRAGKIIGVIQLLNKKTGVFIEEDEAFLKTFGNHASVFLEMAQLQKARIEALEESRKELERLNKAKSRALDHLSHELRTPLAVIQGNIRLLRRKVQGHHPSFIREEIFESLEKNLDRLSNIQQETDEIIRSYPKGESSHSTDIFLYPFAQHVLEEVKQQSRYRNIYFHLEGAGDLSVPMDPQILQHILESLLKNAVENTPDEGWIGIYLERKGGRVLLNVRDSGIGITAENQKSIFDGLFHTGDTDLYASKKPFEFGAGGKGLDLLRIKTHGQHFGFELSVESRRCVYIPMDQDLCPGKISLCPHCQKPEDCFSFGGSTFSISFQQGGK